METTTASSGATAQRKVDRLLEHYGASHRNPRNETIHFVAIPLIMFSLLGLMSGIHPWLPYAFVAASLVYYARLSVVFLVAMAVISAMGLALVEALGSYVLPVSAVIFIGAWVAQFVGHRIEGRKPSFLEDMQYLWVGPLFVLSKLFGKLHLRW